MDATFRESQPHFPKFIIQGGNNQTRECQIWKNCLEPESLPLTQPSQPPQPPSNSDSNSPDLQPSPDEVLLETPILKEEEQTTQQMQNQDSEPNSKI